jgi:hypothetical protein
VALGPRGGTVYTRGMEAAVAQNVASLAATGGLTVVGGGTLTLAGTNAVRGLVDVQEGTLKRVSRTTGCPHAGLLAPARRRRAAGGCDGTVST